MLKIGLIGGSGLYEIPGFRPTREEKITTPYGDPSDAYMILEAEGMEVAFLPRHGRGHAIAPHRINYRANLWGMKRLGVERIIAVNATGGIGPSYTPGRIALPDQIVDFTGGARPSTFFEADDVLHIDFTEPYCPELRGVLQQAARRTGADLIPEGTYVCVNGPRLETPAEIKFFAAAGGHIVGMTGMPEAVLARELEICYSVLAVVTNHAAGLNGKRLTTTEVVEAMGKASGRVKEIIRAALGNIPSRRACPCATALRETRL